MTAALFSVLIVLACPLGMAAMAAAPALGRIFGRRNRPDTVGGS